jgi:hypothetical protein
MGNLQVRFLEGWAPAMAPGYSTICRGALNRIFHLGLIAPAAGQSVSPTRLRFISKKRTGSLPDTMRSPVRQVSDKCVNQDFGLMVVSVTALASSVLRRLCASKPIAPLARPNIIALLRLLLNKECAQPGRRR